MIAQRHFTHTQRESVPLRAMTRCIAARVITHPARTADGRLNIGIGETHAHFCDTIKVRGLQFGMPGTAEVIEPQLIVHDEKNVHIGPFDAVSIHAFALHFQRATKQFANVYGRIPNHRDRKYRSHRRKLLIFCHKSNVVTK